MIVPRVYTEKSTASRLAIILYGFRSNNLVSVFKAAFVIRLLLVSIRSFNKFSPVTNISSSKFAVLRVKFYPW